MGVVSGAATINGQSLLVTSSYTDPVVLSNIIAFRDFTQRANTAGMLLTSNLDGNGATYQMVPNTSTQKAQVPPQSIVVNSKTVPNATATNPLTLIVAGGNDSAHVVSGLVVKNLSLLATPQGHLYNGLRIGYSKNAQIADVNIKGIPGNNGANPGETFSINLWHADNCILTRVNVDGTDSTGNKVAASAFGFNNIQSPSTVDCVAHGTLYGTGATHYKTDSVTHTRFNGSGNKRAFNFERTSGMHQLIDCDMRNGLQNFHIAINSDIASAKLVIVDPLVDTFPVKIRVTLDTPGHPALYMGKPQLQKVSDIQLIINGKDVSHDPKYLFAGNI